MSELPTVLPLFPLPNLVLFPRMAVPLHIFEPRYRQMVADVSESHRFIGMMLLKGNYSEREYFEGYPDMFDVGCAGQLRDLKKLPDGKFNLLLEGVSEFRITREVREKAYRQAEVTWCPANSGALELGDTQMDELRGLLVDYLGEPAREAWQSVVEQRGLRGLELINFICFHLDLTPLEKQTLLQALDERVPRLFDILGFKIEERRSGGGPDSKLVQ